MNYMENALTTEFKFTQELESEKAANLLENRLSGPQKIEEIVIVKSEDMTIKDSEFKNFVKILHKDILALGENIVKGGVHYYITPDKSLISQDQHTAIISYEMAGTRDSANENIDKILEVTNAASGDEFEVMTTGTASINKDSNKASEDTLQKAEITGIPVALIILLVVFGTVVAAIVPLLIAGVAILSAVGATAVTGQFFLLSFFVINMITMMGLAVGIDYSLFVISRFREEKRNGLIKEDAISLE